MSADLKLSSVSGMSPAIDVAEQQILDTLRRKVALADDVDLEAIARATDGFTGADLQALVYNAHLEAVHEAIDQKPENSSRKGSTLDEDEKIEYVTFGPEGSEKKVLSAAEDTAIRRQVRTLACPSWNDTHLKECLTL